MRQILCECLVDDQPASYHDLDREWNAGETSGFNTAARAIRALAAPQPDDGKVG